MFWLGLLVALLGPNAANAAGAASCTADDFAAAVDRSGVALRAFNAGAMPKLRDKLKELKDKKGWGDLDYEERGLGEVRDAHSAELDADAEDLITKIDTLGRPAPNRPPDCAKLAELDAAGLELLAVMKAKSDYTLAKLDKEIAQSQTPAPKPHAEPKVALPAPPTAPPRQPSRKSSPTPWSTRTRAQPEPPAAVLPPPPAESAQKGYTIDEICEITRGFFGTISTSLASVLEYAFSTSGRPDGYVLGQEGGGAFLAGVRYGSGTLYLRSGGTEKVYWHGPSIGTDFGAAGSRTMFLIYNLKEPTELMRGFTGIDGSAYFVGGVGITFLKGGPVLMAPIRSGLGFRLGANLGYIRFTPRPTWNPF
jgi:hypothetical protein